MVSYLTVHKAVGCDTQRCSRRGATNSQGKALGAHHGLCESSGCSVCWSPLGCYEGNNACVLSAIPVVAAGFTIQLATTISLSQITTCVAAGLSAGSA